ncbi:hypothetical protein KUTeg_020925 [Tegillarca granosa]|uniref:Translocon-associated protein subunit delta n=1 Tax=Tegillarca granosa TaxID=220873 RepID=A0ABQ9E9C9_TEGGR|nr:hypothetical protein KUTeg_020925 [Tegillarca granosa]
MESTGMIVIFCSLLIVPFFVTADTCLGPEVKAETYTTTEAVSSRDTVFIVQFQLTCKNKLDNLNLYAEIKGKTIPVTKSVGSNVYQISYSDEPKKLPSGQYDFRLYDDEGYASLRKAQRSGESTDNIKPLYTVSVNHPGVWKGPALQSEFVAALVAILVWYSAYVAKTKLQTTN